MATPINSPAKRGYEAVHSSGARDKSCCQFIVTHCGEAPTAIGMARWFASSSSGGSTQLCVDDETCYQTLADLTVPWGAPPLNTTGLHCELAGYSAWTPAGWLKRRKMLQRAAWQYAKWSIKYGVPVRWLTAAQLRKVTAVPGKGKGGFTSHAEISKAWGKTNHSDPGPGFLTASGSPSKTVPRLLLMGYVKKYRKQMITPFKPGGIVPSATPKPKAKPKPPAKPKPKPPAKTKGAIWRLFQSMPWIPANPDRDKR